MCLAFGTQENGGGEGKGEREGGGQEVGFVRTYTSFVLGGFFLGGIIFYQRKRLGRRRRSWHVCGVLDSRRGGSS